MILSKQEIVDLIPEEFAGLNSQAMCIQMAELVVKEIERKLEKPTVIDFDTIDVDRQVKTFEKVFSYLITDEVRSPEGASVFGRYTDRSLNDKLEAWLISARYNHGSKQHTQDWYGVRWERLRDLLEGTEYWGKACSIIANGIAEHGEPPKYAQIVNSLRHQVEALKTREPDAKLPSRCTRVGKLKIESAIDQGAELIRDAVILRHPDGSEQCADAFGRFVRITQPDPAADAEA